ncbi:MAG: hypothetical protein BWY78_00345 [Alphaproteobacteria bacterium ADurb.Bin438]|nr:MAG: hypothetical protein BWY78_00345 [Alphaproteobacteria bacterium ADurb.Bin438]
MLSKIKKHSIAVAGHKTSIALEKDFYDELKKISEEKGTSLNNLITEIDKNKNKNLSSAIRLFVLQELKQRISKYENHSPG